MGTVEDDCMVRNRSANMTEQHSFVHDTVGEGGETRTPRSASSLGLEIHGCGRQKKKVRRKRKMRE